MCSRYSLTSPPEAVRSYFDHSNVDDFPPRTNIAPTQPVAIIRHRLAGDRAPMPELALVRWGLLPPWVKTPAEFATLINARSETVTEKPSFRGSIRHRRCLIPTDGFYEWTGKPGSKRPHLIRPKLQPNSNHGHLMAMAGLWEHWAGADGSELETMAILTVGANATMEPIHDRMPVILQPEKFDVWLDCRSGSATHVLSLLQPAPNDLLEVIPVSRDINHVGAQGLDLQRLISDVRPPALGTKLI
jgi:putative SOS response-associated peptidase YedK